MIIRELVTRWAFDIDDKKLQSTEQQFSALTGSIKMLSIGVAGAAATIFGFVKTTANAGDEVAKTSQKIGVNVESLQELQHAAGLAGVGHEQLATGLKFLNKNIVESAKYGSEQAKTFQKLGIATKDASGKFIGADTVLTKVADQFKKMPDGPKKTALALELFGKAGTDLVPLLNSGSASISELRQEARDLGLVMDEETTKKSEEFNDSLTKLMGGLTGIRNMVGAELIPVLLEVTNGFLEFVKANRAMIATKIQTVLGAMVNFIKAAVTFLGPLVKGIFKAVGAFLEMKKVMLILGTLFAAFYIGGAIQAAFAMLPILIFKGVAAFNALTISAIAAKVAIFAIPALIGLAFIALMLIIEDIIAFFQGKDSVTAIIVEKFNEMFAKLAEGFNSFGDFAKIAISALLAPVRMLVNAFQTLLDVVSLVRGKMSFKDFGVKALGNLANSFGFGAESSLGSALGFESASAAAGVAPTPGVGALAPQGGASQKNQINVEVQVDANGRDDAATIGRNVGNKTAGELDAVMRDTMRTFQGAGGY